MKKSLSHLPKEKRDDLHLITQYILETLTESCEMIILYGSYARGNYVDYDQRIEYGIPTYFMSDYDILIITTERFKSQVIGNMLHEIKKRYYHEKGISRMAFTTTIQFIQESIGDFNKAIQNGRYFYTDIKKEGIMLYDSKRHILARRRKLNFQEIRDLAKEYYDDKFDKVNGFLRQANHAYNDIDYRMASFLLHQACENCYRAIVLTFTLYSDKVHNLEELSRLAKTHTLEISKAFPRDTDEEKRIFQLLTEAYVQARYNPHFVVIKEDIEAIIPKVELLRDITKTVCEEKIKEYEKR